MNWYALRVRSRFEKTVRAALQGKGYEEFLPLCRKKSQWSDRTKNVDLPLFPGYVFSNFDIQHRLPILMIPGVVHIVGIGNAPEPVSQQELEAIRQFLASGLPVLPWPYLQVGQKVVVEHGALTGVEGILTQVKGQTRLVISVTLLQRSVAVEIDRDWIRPVPPTTERHSDRAASSGAMAAFFTAGSQLGFHHSGVYSSRR